MLHPYASPLMVSCDDPDMCPILIQVGGRERVRDDSLYFFVNNPNLSVQLEMYQDAVHVFQLFCPFDRFSAHAVKNMGQFLVKHTGLGDKKRPKRSATFILNQDSFPRKILSDVQGILEDGIEHLIENGIWTLHGNMILKK
jgi:hypothetical protein